MNQVTEVNDRGIVDPSHPPIIDSAVLTASSKSLKAGTVLKFTSNAETFEPAGANDTPACVLMDDVEAHASEEVNARVLRHGLVVKSRLLNYASTSEVAAGDTLINKLPAVGIYPTSGVWNESNFN